MKGSTATSRNAYQTAIVKYVIPTSRFLMCASSCRTTALNAGGSAACLTTRPPPTAML